MTQISSRTAADPDYSEANEWVRRNAVTLAGVLLIGVQIWWKASFLSHFYFRQDDFRYWARAAASSFSWSYLMDIGGGHLQPGNFALIWVLARISMYDWTLASIVTFILLAASSLAMLRLLRTLFGPRPAILIPLTVGLFTPLTLSALSFWADTLDYLPLQLAALMAANAHVNYVRSGRTWHAATAFAWLALGMAVGEEGVLVPVLLFALTSAFLLPGSWRRTSVEALKKYWRGWAGYGLLMAVYVVIFTVQQSTASRHPTRPGFFSGVLAFAWSLVRVSFVPGALGGPWKWYSVGNFAFAVESGLTQVSWIVAALVILTSLWFRQHAWRAWVILAGWILVADMLPVVIGRVSSENPVLLGLDLHYVADSVEVLVVCLGLAFLPVVGEERPYRARFGPALPRYAVVSVLIGCFLAGSVWSADAYEKVTTSQPERSYVATAIAAVHDVQPGTVVISAPVPSDIMIAPLFGPWAYTASVIGPLVPAGKHLIWTRAPQGIVPNLMMFDTLGRLRTVIIKGPSSLKPSGKPGPEAGQREQCWPLSGIATRIPLDGDLYRWPWIARVSYSGPADTLELQFGGRLETAQVPAGRHVVYIPATGGGNAVTLRSLVPAPGACVSSITVGSAQPSPTAYPVPFFPVP